MVDHYSAALGLDADLWDCLVCMYWLETVALFIRTDCNEVWLRRNALAPLGRLLAPVSDPALAAASDLQPRSV
jgi:hypothetical protein